MLFPDDKYCCIVLHLVPLFFVIVGSIVRDICYMVKSSMMVILYYYWMVVMRRKKVMWTTNFLKSSKERHNMIFVPVRIWKKKKDWIIIVNHRLNLNQCWHTCDECPKLWKSHQNYQSWHLYIANKNLLL